MDKSIDVGAIVDPVQLKSITDMIAANDEGELYAAPVELPVEGSFYPPTLITGLSPSAKLMQEEIFGPVLVATTFRTPEEAVSLANNTRYGLAATGWSENVNLPLSIAPQQAAGVVRGYATHLLDAAACPGGVRASRTVRACGVEGLYGHARPQCNR